MKRLKKQVLAVLCILTCIFALTACSKAEGEAMSEQESASLQQSAEAKMLEIMKIGDTQGQAAVAQYRDNGVEVIAAALESYLSAKEDLGAYQSASGGSAVKTADGCTITLNTLFQQRGCTLTIILDEKMEQITSMSFTPVYTTGENMTRAALNTLMGMGTVFAVLIFISWLISCFRYIRMYEDKMNKKKTPAPAPVVAKAPAAPAPAENLADDLELVAVITAAIAASTGASADGLVVRSIRRAPGSKWKKA